MMGPEQLHQICLLHSPPEGGAEKADPTMKGRLAAAAHLPSDSTVASWASAFPWPFQGPFMMGREQMPGSCTTISSWRASYIVGLIHRTSKLVKS